MAGIGRALSFFPPAVWATRGLSSHCATNGCKASQPGQGTTSMLTSRRGTGYRATQQRSGGAAQHAPCGLFGACGILRRAFLAIYSAREGLRSAAEPGAFAFAAARPARAPPPNPR